MLYFLVGLLVGGISVLLLVNVYLMVVLCRHRRQLRGLGVQPTIHRRRRRRRTRQPPPSAPAETASFVNGGPPPSPELSRRAVQRPRPPRRPPSPFQVIQPTTPTSPPGQVHIPPRDSPVFVHVESPRESPLLGRVPPAPGAAGSDVVVPPSDSLVREESPVWVRFQEAATSDGTLAVPAEEPGPVMESPVWVHLAMDDSPSTTVSTTTTPAPRPSSSSVSPASTLGGPRRAAAVVYPGPPASLPQSVDTLSRSYSNPYRQDTYRTVERRTTTAQRPRQRRLLRFD